MAYDESQSCKCLFHMWQQKPVSSQADTFSGFDVHLRINFVVEYHPNHWSMNVRSQSLRFKLQHRDLLGDGDEDEATSTNCLNAYQTMSRLLQNAAPVNENDLARIAKTVKSKAKSIHSDVSNIGRDVISVLMSLRVVYVKEYIQEIELSWAARLGIRELDLTKRRIPALDSASGCVNSLDRIDYDKDSCKEEQCSICLVGFSLNEEICRTACGHDFHETCVVDWLRRSHQCPLCRFPMPVCANTEDLCPFKPGRAIKTATAENRRGFRRTARMRVVRVYRRLAEPYDRPAIRAYLA